MIHRRLLTALVGPGLVHAASQWCQELGADLGLAHADRYRLELCVEELATNLVKYGGDACAGRRVDWSVEVGEAELRLELVDPCVPFDPLAYEVAPLAPTLAELQVGGRGIQLLREFSDAGAYEFRDGCNRLALTFALEQPARAPGRPDGLADVAIFDGVPAAMVDDALRPVTVLDVADDVVLLERGEANDAVLLVLRGSLRVHLDDPGGEDFLEIGAGECVGEMSVIDDRPVSAYVRALPGARLLVVGAHAFLERVLTVPGVARNVMSAQAERMRRSDALNVARMRQLMEMEQARREMGFARTIQASMLPAEPLLDDDARLDCVGRMRPAREVGGDFYDLFLLDRRHLLFIVADVCGKSLPAALFMVRAIAALRAQPRQATPSDQHLEELVASLNEQLCDHNAARQFMTAFFGVLDLETYRLRYVNAGHNPPLLAAGDAPFTYWGEPVNPPVGMVRGLSYRSGEVELGPRGRVLLYTDGVTEAEDPGGRMLGEDRLLDRCRSLTAEGSQALVDAVFSEVDEFADGARQSDDITVLAIGPGAGSPASP